MKTIAIRKTQQELIWPILEELGFILDGAIHPDILDYVEFNKLWEDNNVLINECENGQWKAMLTKDITL